jgi:collagenase-like PrtC family protease
MAIVYTQTDLDKLKEALLTGAEEVVIGDRRIRYRSQKELATLIKMVQESLENSTASTSNSSVIQATYNKGRSE